MVHQSRPMDVMFRISSVELLHLPLSIPIFIYTSVVIGRPQITLYRYLYVHKIGKIYRYTTCASIGKNVLWSLLSRDAETGSGHDYELEPLVFSPALILRSKDRLGALRLLPSWSFYYSSSTPGLYWTFGRHFLSKVVFYTFVLTTRHPFTERVKKD